MFRKLKNWIQRGLTKLFSIGSASQAMGVEIAASSTMLNNITSWKRLYSGNPPWLWDGGERIQSMTTLGTAATIANKVAKHVTLEAKTSVEGENEKAKFLNSVMQTVWADVRRNVEYACALGGVVFKPYVVGGDVAVGVVLADSFFPTAFDQSGDVTGAIFTEQLVRGKYYYTRLEYHDFTPQKYTIRNKAFRSEMESELGIPVDLSVVGEWADIEPEVTLADAQRPLFAYFKMPFANPIDPLSPLGVSIYARAIPLLQNVDEQYSRILWEYEGSELALDADITALTRDANGNLTVPKRDKRLFRNTRFQGGDTTGDFYKVFSPAIRDESLFNGLNQILRQVETACGLSFGTLADMQVSDRTATEIRYSKQDMYTTVTDIQRNLENALRQLLSAVNDYVELYRLVPPGKFDLTLEFGDGILTDPDAERVQDLQEVSENLLAPWEYRVKWRGESEEQAKEMVSELAGSRDDGITFDGA